MGPAWRVHGEYMESTWRVHGECGGCMGAAWRVHGECGGCMGAAWAVHALHVTVMGVSRSRPRCRSRVKTDFPVVSCPAQQSSP